MQPSRPQCYGMRATGWPVARSVPAGQGHGGPSALSPCDAFIRRMHAKQRHAMSAGRPRRSGTCRACWLSGRQRGCRCVRHVEPLRKSGKREGAGLQGAVRVRPGMLAGGCGPGSELGLASRACAAMLGSRQPPPQARHPPDGNATGGPSHRRSGAVQRRSCLLVIQAPSSKEALSVPDQGRWGQEQAAPHPGFATGAGRCRADDVRLRRGLAILAGAAIAVAPRQAQASHAAWPADALPRVGACAERPASLADSLWASCARGSVERTASSPPRASVQPLKRRPPLDRRRMPWNALDDDARDCTFTRKTWYAANDFESHGEPRL